MTGAWRTMYAAEEDYLKDLVTRWQSWSYVAAGGGLVLAVIAASMHGYIVPGFSRVGDAMAYGLAGVIGGGGLVICGVLQAVARRLQADLAAARVESVAADGTAAERGKYVEVAAAGNRFLLARPDWLRHALPLGPGRLALEFTPVSRVVLTVNGAAVYGPAAGS